MGAAVTAEPKSKSKADVSPEPAASAPSAFELEVAYGAPAGMPLFLGIGLQRKLAVGAVDDPLEREADQVAERVMRMPDATASPIGKDQPVIRRKCAECEEEKATGLLARAMASGEYPRIDSGFGSAGVQRKCACGGSSAGECEECKREEELPATPTIRRRADASGTNSDSGSSDKNFAPPVVHEALRSSGSPIDASVRPLMENRFGRDFGDVRVHTDSLAAKSAQAVNALAYTAGKDVVFGPGQYSPQSGDGQRLLAHELTHVVQQSNASVEHSSESLTRCPSQIGASATFEPLGRVMDRAERATPIHNTVVRRQNDSTSTIPPAVSTDPAAPPAPAASPQSVADPHEIDLVKTALDSGDPADVKRITNFAAATQDQKFKLIQILLNQGWVGPRDEYALEDIWKSFGDAVVALASANFELWNACIDRGAELEDLPAVRTLRKQFEFDIKTVVTGYMFQNRGFVMNEMQRLGIPPEEAAPMPPPTEQQTDEIEKMQSAAESVAKLQKAQEEAKQVIVGFEPSPAAMQIPVIDPNSTQVIPEPPREPHFNPVFFDPYRKPPLDQDPEAQTSLFGGTPYKVTPYDTVKVPYEKANDSIASFLNLYPSLYAVSREGKSKVTGAFSAIASPAEARQQLGVALRQLFRDIEETQTKLDGGDLNPLDLTPIHDQLYGGLSAPSGVDWKLSLPQSVAKDMVGDHQFAEALKSIGLQTAASALFMLAPFTGGASIFVMLAGLAVTGAKLYLSTEQYETLAQAAQTSPTPGTELVQMGQVDDAKMAMEADQIAFALAAIVVLATAAGSLLTKGPAQTLAEARAGTLRETMSKSKAPRATSVAVNSKTGKSYFGDSGKPYPTVIHPELKARMPSPSMEKWPVENCAEFKAANQAMLDGAKLEDLEVHTVKVQTGEAFTSCQNCQKTLSGAKVTSN